MPTFEQIESIIRTRFGTLVQDPYGYQVQYDNMPFTPPGNAAWIRLSILFGASNNVASAGTKHTYRTVGIMDAMVNVPVESGDQPNLDIADTIKDKFRAITYQGITFKTPSVKPLGRNGTMWQINVRCPFYSDEIA